MHGHTMLTSTEGPHCLRCDYVIVSLLKH